MIKRRRDLTPKEFEQIYSRVARITVEIMAFYDGKIALIKRKEKSWQGQMHLPGGSVAYQETLIDAVKRNAREELDVEVEVGEQIGYIEYPSEIKERGFGWSIGIVFVCKIVGDIDFDLWEQESVDLYSEIPDNLIAEQRSILEIALDSNKNT